MINKLLLIDSRINDYQKIINSTNNDTACIIFNYFVDTFNSIKEKITQISNINKVIYDTYQGPKLETNFCDNCIVYENNDNNEILNEFLLQHPVITENIIEVKPTSFESIGIIQHNFKLKLGSQLIYDNEGIPSYKLFDSSLFYILNKDLDPNLTTWEEYKDFILFLKNNYSLQNFDLMACSLYSDPEWAYVIDNLQLETNVNIRASYDNTGSSQLNGNWFLETDNINLKTVYFTDAIEDYQFLFYYTDSRFYIVNLQAGQNTTVFVEVPHNNNLNIMTGNFTIEAWYYQEIYQRDATVIDKGVYGYLFQIYPNSSTSALGFYTGNGGWSYSNGVNRIQTNAWNHVACTYVSSSRLLSFYVNGFLVGTITRSTATLLSNSGPVNIGRQAPGNCNCNLARGYLYDVRLWTTTRTQTQLRKYKNIILPTNTPNLVANWLLTDNSNTTVTERINGYNGTIQNPPGTINVNSVKIPNIGYLINRGYSLTTNNSSGAIVMSSFTDMADTDFLGADLSNVNFSNQDLTNCNFNNCNLTSANFTGACLLNASFINANMTTTTLSSANINNYRKSGANISTQRAYGFPQLGNIKDWTITINFRATGGNGTWRALVGAMYDGSLSTILDSRFWGIWINDSQVISWYHSPTTTVPLNTLTVSLNVNYKLVVNKVNTTITATLTNLDANTSVSESLSTIGKNMGTYNIVSIGGNWIYTTYGSDAFVGNITYIDVTDNTSSLQLTGANLKNVVASSINGNILNNSLRFNRTGSNYILVPYNSSLDMTTQLTIEGWVYPITTDNWINILIKGNSGYGLALTGTVYASYKLSYGDINGSYDTAPKSDVSYTFNTWQHVAVTVYTKGSQIICNFYINGVNVGADKISPNSTSISNGGANSALYIGAQGSALGNHFNGNMEELRIWNYCRSETEIQTFMNRELVGNENGLVLYYNFNTSVLSGNNTQMSTINDLSNYGNNGTLTNFTLTGSSSNYLDTTNKIKPYSIVNGNLLGPGLNLSNVNLSNLDLSNLSLIKPSLNITKNIFDTFLATSQTQTELNEWQYLAINSTRTSTNFLTWRASSVFSVPQWDNNIGSLPYQYDYPFVSRLPAGVSFTSGTTIYGPVFVMCPQDDDNINACVAWKNISVNTKYINVTIKLSTLYANGANVLYYIHRNLVGNARYQLYQNNASNNVTAASGVVTETLTNVEMQSGEKLYLVLNRNGTFSGDFMKVEFIVTELVDSTNVNLTNANLSGSNLTNTDLSNANLTGTLINPLTNLTGTTLTNIKGLITGITNKTPSNYKII